ncbi:MAG: hypothetical protein Q8R36_04140 [bacterium]|nr:hypothetical protein [bacterium]
MLPLAVFGFVVGFVALIVVGSIANGFVLSVLWGWFIVPTLGLPALSVVQAIGIAMVVSYLTYHYIDTQKGTEDKREKIAMAIGMVILRPLFALFFGWIIHLFM